MRCKEKQAFQHFLSGALHCSTFWVGCLQFVTFALCGEKSTAFADKLSAIAQWQSVCLRMTAKQNNMSNKKTKEQEQETQEKQHKAEQQQEAKQEKSETTDQKASKDNKSSEKKQTKKSKKKDSKSELKEKVKELEDEVAELKDKNLRLFAEFDNFRKRTARERNDMMASAGQDVIRELLPILDDIRRAENQLEDAKDVESVRKGYQLITKKLTDILHNKGLQEMEVVGQKFDPDLHEAITEIPAPSEEDKGKVLDEVEKGYYLNDRILRHARVVVGK